MGNSVGEIVIEDHNELGIIPNFAQILNPEKKNRLILTLYKKFNSVIVDPNRSMFKVPAPDTDLYILRLDLPWYISHF